MVSGECSFSEKLQSKSTEWTVNLFGTDLFVSNVNKMNEIFHFLFELLTAFERIQCRMMQFSFKIPSYNCITILLYFVFHMAPKCKSCLEVREVDQIEQSSNKIRKIENKPLIMLSSCIITIISFFELVLFAF